MTGALLSEVWPDMVQKPRKTRRLKKKKVDDPLLDQPLTPDEMETELLDDRSNNELDPRRRLKGMRVSPYTDDEIQYQDTSNKVDLELNDNIVRPSTTRNIRKESLSDDPDYQEFLEFKRMRNQSAPPQHVLAQNSTEEQFNELLLYVFTGFFLLMIYDNIYKLGKDNSFY
jgi:hypothetical protein